MSQCPMTGDASAIKSYRNRFDRVLLKMKIAVLGHIVEKKRTLAKPFLLCARWLILEDTTLCNSPATSKLGTVCLSTTFLTCQCVSQQLLPTQLRRAKFTTTTTTTTTVDETKQRKSRCKAMQQQRDIVSETCQSRMFRHTELA